MTAAYEPMEECKHGRPVGGFCPICDADTCEHGVPFARECFACDDPDYPVDPTSKGN